MLVMSDSTRLELMNWSDTLPHVQQPREQGLTHLSIGVGSQERVDALASRLVEDGYACTSGPRMTGDGYYESSIVGPEGLIIEVTV